MEALRASLAKAPGGKRAAEKPAPAAAPAAKSARKVAKKAAAVEEPTRKKVAKR